VDYTNAFAQATLHKEVYICIPIGFEKPGQISNLLQSLNGLVQAPRTLQLGYVLFLADFLFGKENFKHKLLHPQWKHDV
jgi:hypothetical protein